MKIQAQVVAHSKSPQGDELLSVLVTFPRFILAELNTHRMLSKNSASSRAIPTKKLLQMIKEDPFVPIAWQKEHKGMQGYEYFTNQEEIDTLFSNWMNAVEDAIEMAEEFTGLKTTKQIANRLLEPFMWHTVLITGNVNKEGWLNFFDLRCPQYYIGTGSKPPYNLNRIDSGLHKSRKKIIAINDGYRQLNELDWLKLNKGQAEIHMMALAEAIYDAWQESTPRQLQAGEWHIPFGDKITNILPDDIWKHAIKEGTIVDTPLMNAKIKISTAMAARTSYTVVGDEKEVSYETLLGIHDKMVNAKPFHASPFEHCAPAMSKKDYERFLKGKVFFDYDTHDWSIDSNAYGWCRNFRGFIQYRHILESSF